MCINLLSAACAAHIWYRRINKVTRTTKSLVRGIGIGMAVGAAAGMAGGIMGHSNKKMLRRKAGRAADFVGDLVENVTYLFK